MFFPRPRPVQEFSLAELVAKITELTQRQRRNPNGTEGESRDPNGGEDCADHDNGFGQELTE
jgi:hypothetical protein